MTLPPAERAQNPQSDVEWLHEQILDFQATSNTHQIALDKHYRGLAMVLEAQAAEIARLNAGISELGRKGLLAIGAEELSRTHGVLETSRWLSKTEVVANKALRAGQQKETER